MMVKTSLKNHKQKVFGTGKKSYGGLIYVKDNKPNGAVFVVHLQEVMKR
ncbi:MAG: hypothetical protein U9P79_07915 [Candidatus Cloacimonadota bacterium]|nr:hypothetical protein [Candidatus Cloacimonadota bacterium]